MKKYIAILVTCLLLTVVSAGQNQFTENTLRIEKDIKGEPASPDMMNWLNGDWSGSGLGGSVKEAWTNTGAGVMMGMFVFVKDSKPVFYEFMTFSVDNGQLYLKLKHFTPEMVGWEEKDKTVKFRFIKRDKTRYYFHGLTFENINPGKKLNIYLALTTDRKVYKEEVFRFTRLG